MHHLRETAKSFPNRNTACNGIESRVTIPKMPIITPVIDNPFQDGRQSERALAVRVGVERYFAEMSWATLPELTLKSGRRADIVALSPKGDIIIVEIKSSVEDLRADTKWPDYRPFCDNLWFATLPDVPADIFPIDAGFMIADAYGAELKREGEGERLSPAARKALHLRFARASALRLARCCAHAGIAAAEFQNADDPL